MSKIIFQDIVKIMERGQVTIPLKLRELFNFQKGFRLWIRVNQDRKIELEPVVEDREKQLNQWLKKMLNDKTQYFIDFDEKKLRQIRKKSKNKILRLYEKNSR